jgi:hypothetical protein
MHQDGLHRFQSYLGGNGQSFKNFEDDKLGFLRCTQFQINVRNKREIKKNKFGQARNTMLGLALRANQPSSNIACIKS